MKKNKNAANDNSKLNKKVEDLQAKIKKLKEAMAKRDKVDKVRDWYN